jgi:GntR family transcriptional regulator
MAVTDPTPTRLEAQPLYVRARNIMVDRLINGDWRPGEMLPSEFALAAEIGVSQGTMRKALDDMTAQGLLVRRQGRGTFVAEPEDNSILFRFYRLTPNDSPNSGSAPTFPESRYLSRAQRAAGELEQQIFGLSAKDTVWRFERVRSNEDGPILWEQLVLPAKYFPDLSAETQLPNNVYQFYSTFYGIIVARVNEQLRAITSPENIADLLSLPAQSPLLEIDRRAIALDDRVVEWRRSLCRSDTMHYRNELK